MGASLNQNIQWDLSKLPVFEKNFYLVRYPHTPFRGVNTTSQS